MKKLLLFLLFSTSCIGLDVVVLDSTFTNVVGTRSVDAAWYSNLVVSGNAKANFLRPIVATEKPAPTNELQFVQFVGYTVTPTNAVEIWNLADVDLPAFRSERESAVEPKLREFVHPTPYGELKLDALQSEFLGLLLHAYMQNTELLLLVTKAVGASTLTNNLTAPERQRVAALRPQISFPRQDDFTPEDRARAVAIRDNVLIPHYQLYQAAKFMLERIRTNTIPEDPMTSTNWPAVIIGE